MAEVDLSNIKPNSRASKQAEKEKLQPVIHADKRSEKKEPKKILGFIDPEDVKELAEYAIFDVIIPEMKSTFLESIAIAIGMDGFVSRGSSRGRGGSRTSYSSYYKGRERDRDYDRRSSRRDDRRDRDRDEELDYRDIRVRDRSDAQEIVDKLRRRIEETGEATIADLYQLVDVSSKYTDENWGWTNPKNIGIRYVGRDGYLIDVTEARYLY